MMWLSELFRRAAFAQSPDEVVTWLVTLEHPSWTEPVRLARDVEVTSVGRVFRASGVDVRFPEIARGPVRPGALRLPNVDEADRAAIAALRDAAGEPVRVTVELVLLSDPDTAAVTLRGLRVAGPTSPVPGGASRNGERLVATPESTPLPWTLSVESVSALWSGRDQVLWQADRDTDDDALRIVCDGYDGSLRLQQWASGQLATDIGIYFVADDQVRHPAFVYPRWEESQVVLEPEDGPAG